jgi:hypothetical protein
MLPGISRAIRELNSRLGALAESPDEVVFLTGEPGTERALAARIIHQLGRRAERKFVKVTAHWKLPSDFSAQLEQADGGTVFLHLVREFPVDMQYTLLELALDQTFTDSMTGKPHRANVRLILTTTQDIDSLFSRSALLPDLREILFRNALEVPPLRERPEDIPALVRFALQRARETGHCQADHVDRHVLGIMRKHTWPGNAEELLLIAAQAALKASSSTVMLRDLPEDFLAHLPPELKQETMAVHEEMEEPTHPGAPLPPPSAAGRQVAATDKVARQIVQMDTPSPLREDLLEWKVEVASSADVATGPGEPAGSAPPPSPRQIAAAQSEGPSAPPPARDTAEVPTPIESFPREESPLNVEADELREKELLRLSQRLHAQTALLARQMEGPLPTGKPIEVLAQTRRLRDQRAGDLEGELAKSLEQILILRRQLALLNERERESASVIRELIHRMELTTQLPETTEMGHLAEQLAQVDTIIARVTERLPRISEDIQESIRKIIEKKR